MPGSQKINAVASSFAIVETLVSASSPLGVSHLARELNTNRALVHRHLQTLIALGYCKQDPASEQYSLTGKLASLGRLVDQEDEFLEAVRAVMPGLAKASNMAVSAGRPEAEGVRIVEIVRNRSKVEIATPIGTLFEYELSAQGRVVAAFADKARSRVSSPTQDKQKMSDLEAEFAQIRRYGWASSIDESLPGISALAAPVFDCDGKVAGTLALVGLTDLIQSDRQDDIIHQLIKAAQAASDELGFSTQSTSLRGAA